MIIAPGNLVLHLPMNEGTGTALAARVGAGATLLGATSTWVNAKIGKGVYFTSNGEALSQATISYTTYNISLSLWLMVPAIQSLAEIFQCYTTNLTNFTMDMQNNLYFYYYSGNTQYLASSVLNANFLNKWHLINGVIDNTNGRIKLYIDGKEVCNNPAAATRRTDATAYRMASIHDGTRHLTGSISNVQIHNIALTEKQVAVMYESHKGAYLL